jgi:Protein-glutamine gamma-glutamyltransferase
VQHSHPRLYEALQAQWRDSAIASGRFHDTFLHEFGSNEEPLPMRYYVPGDRVWFRNPDEASSDASGYEGSWTVYLGAGHFANMWKRNQPFTLRTKCVEVHHWRDATYRDAEGDLRIDERVVEQKVAETMADPVRTDEVVNRMLRLRDLKGIYAEGGCIDRTREGPRFVRPGTTDIPLVMPVESSAAEVVATAAITTAAVATPG